ncbi:HAD family hydrolase [Azospirillum picis]|uniref:FMN phosphatase YigB (HAD superfamily) n=1 Tax=Azospirillum picis TaxID=488438 RepID=A0ABU0MU51_9PROT|nr:HAD family hydrolase [Azospirillum picis]MBP2303208.1 FMN phosphatase YigB (HAD superfamily) [Azospirillum picis]MDQ0536985.1 FMN phosphatase YigB (HAD superfamily) [Azospirillum picis]
MTADFFPSFDHSELADAVVVSCDVFDTLLLRRVSSPALVFNAVGQEAVARCLVDSSLTPPLFRLARQEAERRVRAEAPGGEATLAEIYRRLNPRNSEILVELELEVEAALIYANPLIVKVLEALARQERTVVLLSDMYLTTEQISHLLRLAGIGDHLYHTLYVSNEHGCSKRDGRLFQRLLCDYPAVTPSQILHIGDDPIGDVAMARAAGLRAIHYVPSATLSHHHDRERIISGLGAVALPSRRLVSLAGRNDPEDQAPWLEFGSLVLGPAVVEYCRWVVENCHQRGIGLIAPLMREAAVFAPLMQDWIRHRGYDIGVVPLHVSRQALTPLEFCDINHDSARETLSAKPHMVWNWLLEQAGGTVPQSLSSLTGQTLEMLAGQKLASGAFALETVLDLFDDPALRKTAAARAVERKALILEHLADRLGKNGPVALVDLGARGSTPAALAKLVHNGKTRFHIYLCYAVNDLANAFVDGLHVSVYVSGSERSLSMGRILYRSPQILERALTGLAGTTLGYERNNLGSCTPKTAVPPALGQEAVSLEWLQAGIRRYAALVFATAPSSGAFQPCPGDEALLPLTAALMMPTIWEADALGGLSYDQNDGVEGERVICDTTALNMVRPLADMKDGPVMGLALGLRPVRVPWPQGALTRLDPAVFRRPADMLGIEVGHAPVCRALVARLLGSGMRRVVVLAVGGDGGMGPDFIRIAREEGLELVAYADLMGHLMSSPLFHGVPVARMDCLASLASTPLALVTLGYAERLAELVRQQCVPMGLTPTIVALARPDLE